MSILRVGPHDQWGGAAGLDWARVANVVKSHINPSAIQAAPPHALLIYRGPVSDGEQGSYIDRMDVEGFAARTLGQLGGWGAGSRRLFIEGPNEPDRGQSARLVEFYKRFKRLAGNGGYRVCGFNAATGNYEADDVDRMREAELDLWTFHCYMTREKGATKWNAERPLLFRKPGDPPYVVTEWGHDRCRDGDNSEWVPSGDGPFGWLEQFAGRPDPEGEAFAQLAGAAERMTDTACLGLLLFTTSPDPTWRDKKFDCDPLAPRFTAAMGHWPSPVRDALYARFEGSTQSKVISGPPAETGRPAPKPHTTSRTPVKEPTMPDWCPFAKRKLIERNYTPGRAGRAVQLIVDHIAEGDSSPFGWFNRVPKDENDGSSAHFWIGYDGTIEQYRPLSDTCWANGPKCKPDMSVPLVKAAVDSGMIGMNSISVAIEHAGWSGKPLAAAQIASSRKLHGWLNGVYPLVKLDRQHVIGHAQIDLCTRAGCPGPTFPWSEILSDPKTPKPFNIDVERDALWKIKERLAANGWPRFAQAIEAAVTQSKGER